MVTEYELSGRDGAFLESNPVDALWGVPLTEGCRICVCAGCRATLFADDWDGRCPICNGGDRVHFSVAAQLMAREPVVVDGVRASVPLRPRRVTVTRTPAPRTRPSDEGRRAEEDGCRRRFWNSLPGVHRFAFRALAGRLVEIALLASALLMMLASRLLATR